MLGLLLLLFMGVFQLGLVLHLRNLMTAAAADGARYAANADRSSADGAERAREALRAALPAALVRTMTVTAGPDPTDPGVMEVTISGPAPLLLTSLAPLRITVHGHALSEQP